jgi:flagellar biosynthesis protein FlhG
MMQQSKAAHPRGATVAITSGKGGVGKTSLTVNLAAALARLGHQVGILDADLGLGNIDVMLGLTPGAHVGSVLGGDCALDEVMVDGPDGIRVIPAGSGIPALTALTPIQWARLTDTVQNASAALDFLLLDTSPGINDTVLDLVRLADRVIVVTSYEPTAIVDAYAMVKLLVTADDRREIGVVVNAARDAAEGQLVFRQLDVAAKRFLGRGIRYYGYIARDPNVSDAVIDQRPLVNHLPDSPASRCFRTLALRVANWPSRGPALGASKAVPPPPIVAPIDFESAEAPRCA